MSAVLEPRYTIDEYLAREQVAPHKSEFYRGQIFAMSGGTPRHNKISGNLYRQLDSLREYILVTQDEPQVERFVRQDDGSWNLTVFKGLEALLKLPALACELPLREIYENITIGPEE